MASDPAERSRALAAYDDGVQGVATAAMHIRDWSAATPCAEWHARDLAGHLVAVVRYFKDLLDAATAGRPRSDLPRGADLRTMNARDLAALPQTDGPDRIATFLALAEGHRARLSQVDWSLVFGEWAGVGPLSVGEHTALAAGEWHIHAWDLASSSGRDHRPADPSTLALGRSVLAGSLSDGDPWLATLESAGRCPAAPLRDVPTAGS